MVGLFSGTMSKKNKLIDGKYDPQTGNYIRAAYRKGSSQTFTDQQHCARLRQKAVHWLKRHNIFLIQQNTVWRLSCAITGEYLLTYHPLHRQIQIGVKRTPVMDWKAAAKRAVELAMQLRQKIQG